MLCPETKRAWHNIPPLGLRVKFSAERSIRLGTDSIAHYQGLDYYTIKTALITLPAVPIIAGNNGGINP